MSFPEMVPLWDWGFIAAAFLAGIVVGIKITLWAYRRDLRNGVLVRHDHVSRDSIDDADLTLFASKPSQGVK